MSEPTWKLYHYWRSSSSWRVRIALHWKGIPFDAIPVGLLDGESESDPHLSRNPAGFVPVLEVSPGRFLTESLAILQYLEKTHPDPALLPRDPWLLAKAWALSEVINAGIQPIANIPVMAHHSSDPEEQKSWCRHFIRQGLAVYESLLKETAKEFSVGSELSVADLCLIPQTYNAVRYQVDLEPFPLIRRIQEKCLELPAFHLTRPDCYQPPGFKG